MTDDTGLLEHSLGIVPRRKEGYSTDDQARALWACLEWLEWVEDEQSRSELFRLMEIYLSFLLWVQKEDGHFHNNISYDRKEETEEPSDDCLGRCLWACAVGLARLREDGYRLALNEIVHKALPQIHRLRHSRGIAYALAGLSLLIAEQGRNELRAAAETLAGRLADRYRNHRRPDWRWYEPMMVYSNGVIPWGLLWAYDCLEKPEWLDIALESLDFLIEATMNENRQIRPIGNGGWHRPGGGRALWDQQPIDVMKLALAAAKAYELTGSDSYKSVVVKCRDWFYGENDLGVLMVDPEDGSCCDGLGEHGANRNRGAESTLAFLITEALYLDIKSLREKRRSTHVAASSR
jgi:hypothetical protein